MKVTRFRCYFRYALLLSSLAPYYPTAAAESQEFLFRTEGESYRYSVSQTGENYTFKFDRAPSEQTVKLLAGNQVLRDVYHDDTIEPRYSQHYIRERARCYVFDSRFYTYTLCFLPNDFNRAVRDRFWGFITRVPNWKWLLSRIFLPAILAFAAFFYLRRKSNLG